ncbi:MAG: TPM domain-containing protein [Nitrospira sp.]
MPITNMSRVWRKPARLFVFLALLLLPGLAWSLDVPPLTGRVMDLAHVLSAETAAALTSDLTAHETKTGNQVTVLVLPSLEGEPLEEWSHRVATTWKLGQKGTDNGVLLLVALKEKKVRIEVGYGLEGILTDLRSAHIIRNEIVPRFRAGDVPAGIEAGVAAILKTIEGTYRAPEPGSPTYSRDETISRVILAVVVGLVFGFLMSGGHRAVGAIAGGGISFFFSPWIAPALIAAATTALLVALLAPLVAGSAGGRSRRGGHDWSWPGGGSGGLGGSFGGGGGFSGGGGDFGGGGASGDW